MACFVRSSILKSFLKTVMVLAIQCIPKFTDLEGEDVTVIDLANEILES